MKPKSLSLRFFDRNTSPGPTSGTAAAAADQHHVDCADRPGSRSARSDSQQVADSSRRKAPKCHREVHFAFLPERYEPLIEEEVHVQDKKEQKKRKREKYKKVKKNVGKALRSTWKCLMLGMYNFALGYSTPITVAATFVPDFHPGRTRT